MNHILMNIKLSNSIFKMEAKPKNNDKKTEVIVKKTTDKATADTKAFNNRVPAENVVPAKPAAANNKPAAPTPTDPRSASPQDMAQGFEMINTFAEQVKTREGLIAALDDGIEKLTTLIQTGAQPTGMTTDHAKLFLSFVLALRDDIELSMNLVSIIRHLSANGGINDKINDRADINYGKTIQDILASDISTSSLEEESRVSSRLTDLILKVYLEGKDLLIESLGITSEEINLRAKSLMAPNFIASFLEYFTKDDARKLADAFDVSDELSRIIDA